MAHGADSVQPESEIRRHVTIRLDHPAVPPEALVAAADTVTDMTMVKHAFKAGVKAMPGLEW